MRHGFRRARPFCPAHPLPVRPLRHASFAVLLLSALLACDSGTPSIIEPPPAGPARLTVELSGIPGNPALDAARLTAAGLGARVRGPQGFDTLLLRSATLTDLPAGTYRVTARPAEFDSIRHAAMPDSAEVVLEVAGARTVAVAYAPVTGGLDLRTAGGPPDAVPLRAALTHPDGRVDTLSLPARVSLLAPGTYVVTPEAREAGGVLYTPARNADTLIVTAGPIGTPTVLAYDARGATLRLVVRGIEPGDHQGIVTLDGADGSRRIVPFTGDTIVFTNLLAGAYVVQAPTFTVSRARYVPLAAGDTIRVAAGVSTVDTLTYRRETAALRVTIAGTPAGADAAVTVSGPFGFTRTIAADTLLADLAPGAYTIAGANITAGGHVYAPAPATQVVNVTFGAPSEHVITYTLATGTLSVAILGLPDSVPAAVTVRAVASTPGFPWTLAATDTRTGVPAGTYVVSAASRVVGSSLHTPLPVERTVIVTPSLTPLVVEVTYTESIGPRLDFAIAGAYVTQAAQRFDGTVPLVASRGALLRVFVSANEGNSERLTVRVRLYEADTVYRTLLIPSPGTSAPLGVNEGALVASWNVLLDAADVREGMSVVADFGEAPGVGDADLENNRWPRTGRHAVEVRPVPPFTLRLVPVQHPVDGLTGNVTAGNAPALFDMSRRLLPLEQIALSVHTPFTTAAPALLANDANNGWSTVLNEINVLRLTEDASGTHYVAIVGTTYSTGIAGLAAIGAPYAVSWDKPLTGPGVLAHELGHTFGRFHSPGCGASFIDPRYPHGSGIGVWGWTGTGVAHPMSTNDIMGYCSTQWISDYTWTGILTFRAAASAGSALFRAAPVPRDSMLLVWGRVGDDGAVLEPAFRVVSTPVLPPVGGGRYAVDVLDAEGRVLETIRFDGDALDHRSDIRTFAFTVPVRSWRTAAAALRVRRGGEVLAVRQGRAVAGLADTERVRADDGRSFVTPPDARVRRRGAALAELSWNETVWPLAMVRDARTGEVLGFVRRPGDAVRLAASGRDLDLVFSDGVRTVTRRFEVP